MAEGSERYRTELAKEILEEPDKQKRREILELARQSDGYQNSERHSSSKPQEVLKVVPNGWYTLSAFMKELGAKKSVLQPLIEQVRRQNPQLVKKYESKVGNTKGVYDCYSPELKMSVEIKLQKQSVRYPFLKTLSMRIF